MASFMNETWRRTAWPREAADCSAARSGSASRTATSVMAADMSFSSCARQASMARNQNSAMGRKIVAATIIMVGLLSAAKKPLRAISGDSMAQARRLPTASHPPEPAAAMTKGWLVGCCCRAKIRPPMEGASSLAATRARGWAAARRRGGGVVGGAASPSAGLAPSGSAVAGCAFGRGLGAAGRSARALGAAGAPHGHWGCALRTGTGGCALRTGIGERDIGRRMRCAAGLGHALRRRKSRQRVGWGQDRRGGWLLQVEPRQSPDGGATGCRRLWLGAVVVARLRQALNRFTSRIAVVRHSPGPTFGTAKLESRRGP